MIWALHEYEDTTPIMLCVSENDEISIAKAAESICKAFEFDGTIVYDTSKADGQFKKTASNEKLRKLIPDFKFTPFDQAIKETVNWFVNNYDTCRVHQTYSKVI